MLRRKLLRLAAGLIGATALAPLPTVASEQGGEPIKIGFSMALTGPLAANGKQALLGAKIWEETVNKKGGLLGRQVKIIYYDDQSNPSTVPGIYTKLLDVDKVDLVAGPYATAMVAPAMPVIMQKGKVSIGSYPLDSVGMVRAVNEANYKPKLIGGAMVGLQATVFKTQLGPLLNGWVNYETWVPSDKMLTPDVQEFLKVYQSRAGAEGV